MVSAPPRPYPPAKGRLAVLEEQAFLFVTSEALTLTPKGTLRVRYHGWSDLMPAFTYSLAGKRLSYNEAVEVLR